MTEPFVGTLNYWVLQTVAMMLTALFIPGLRITGFFGATLTVVALAFVNATIWDAASFLSIPTGLTAQVAVLLVANGVIFWVLVKLLPGIEIHGVLAALAAPVVFAGVSLLISENGRDVDWLALIDRAITGLETLRGVVEEVTPQVAPAVDPPSG
jgi:putative membrane protein